MAKTMQQPGPPATKTDSAFVGDPGHQPAPPGSRPATSPMAPQRLRIRRVEQVVDRARELDARVSAALRHVTLPGMRILLGVLFVWFGGLKVVGQSPVEDIVAGTLPLGDPDLVVGSLGVVEVLLGAALVAGFALRLVLPVLAGHLGGTFLTFAMLPELMFRDSNVLLLTESGEFVTKNLVLIAATLVLVTHTAVGNARERSLTLA